MDILKILGLKDEKPENTVPETKKPNPHAQGGCCGSCGGQKQQ